jgi:predicted esterase YcpF (UPF0227 family)
MKEISHVEYERQFKQHLKDQGPSNASGMASYMCWVSSQRRGFDRKLRSEGVVVDDPIAPWKPPQSGLQRLRDVERGKAKFDPDDFRHIAVIWFHGFGGNPDTSDKVEWLKAAFQTVCAWHIDVDPAVSIPMLRKNIDDVVARSPNIKLVMAGNSLGGWFCSKLAEMFGCPAALINPSYDPTTSLAAYGVAEEVTKNYSPLSWIKGPHVKYFIGTEDKVLDFASVREQLCSRNTEFIEGAEHGFNEVEFKRVIAWIKERADS